MLNPHPQLAPYEQSHDAERTINPSEKLVARGNSWVLRPSPRSTLEASCVLANGISLSRPAHYQKTGELLFVANGINADDCARCVFYRLIAGDSWYAHNRCLAVVWFTCVD